VRVNEDHVHRTLVLRNGDFVTLRLHTVIVCQQNQTCSVGTLDTHFPSLLAYCQRQGTWHAEAIHQLNYTSCNCKAQVRMPQTGKKHKDKMEVRLTLLVQLQGSLVLPIMGWLDCSFGRHLLHSCRHGMPPLSPYQPQHSLRHCNLVGTHIPHCCSHPAELLKG